MQIDLHMHSSFSDGKNTPLEMIVAAIELGYEAVAFTDHVWKHSTWLGEYITEISRLKHLFSSQIKVYCGVEAKVTDLLGSIDFDEAYYDELDFVLAAFHRIPLGDNNYANSPDVSVMPDHYLEKWFLALEGALENPFVDGIAHPFNFQQAFLDVWSIEIETRLLEMILKHNKIAEYNVKYPCALLTDFWGNPGLRISPASDSHSKSELIERSKLIKAFESFFTEHCNPLFPLRG